MFSWDWRRFQDVSTDLNRLEVVTPSSSAPLASVFIIIIIIIIIKLVVEFNAIDNIIDAPTIGHLGQEFYEIN